MELTQQDSGGRRTVRVGDELHVLLPETPTTGYRWYPETGASGLEPAGDSYEGPVEPRGAGGTHRLTFRVLRSGPVRLRLLKRRAWEDTAIEEFIVDLDVEDG